ncbi:MarR family transcriptional regulator [Isoptericola halotolerans]|uniref:MarR family winged helix-turn-helix transcriptional regulator n=1 Tax=Isoptericola halotolerans TaxID=300560 RepID=UPI00388DE26D
MTDPDPPAALTGDELETWAALATVVEWLPAALDAQLQRDAQLTHFEYGVLYALSRAPDLTLRMSVLSGYANSSLSRLSRAVTRLESKGWMRRAPDPADGRSTLAVLTDQGRDKVEQATPGHVHTVRELVLDRLTKPQTRHLREASLRIAQAIRSDGSWVPPASPAPPGPATAAPSPAGPPATR